MRFFNAYSDIHSSRLLIPLRYELHTRAKTVFLRSSVQVCRRSFGLLGRSHRISSFYYANRIVFRKQSYTKSYLYPYICFVRVFRSSLGLLSVFPFPRCFQNLYFNRNSIFHLYFRNSNDYLLCRRR